MSLKVGNGFHYCYPCNKKLDKPISSSLKHILVDAMVSLVIWLKNNYLQIDHIWSLMVWICFKVSKQVWKSNWKIRMHHSWSMCIVWITMLIWLSKLFFKLAIVGNINVLQSLYAYFSPIQKNSRVCWIGWHCGNMGLVDFKEHKNPLDFDVAPS